MAPWERTMRTIILLLLGKISTNVYADITKAPSSGVFLEGSDVTLTCVVEGNENVVWEDFGDATLIFVGKQKNTAKKKYDNFQISSVDGDFSLIIKDIHLSDEGTYVCTDRDQLANATVTIGVLPTLHLYVKQSEATQAPQTSTEVNITCSAYNARPAVSVFELGVVGSEKTMNAKNYKSNQNEDGKTYNASAFVPYIVSSEEISVYCRVFTAGRWLNHTDYFYIPRCNIKISGNEIRCLCQGNPPVNTYYVDVNGHKHDGDVLLIEEDELMNIRCLATNELGTGQSNLLFPDDMHRKGFGIVPIAVIMSVFVLLVVLTVIYIRRRPGPSEKKPDAPVKWHRREGNKNITTKNHMNIQKNDVLETDEPNYYSTADVTEGRSPIIVDEKDISIIHSMKMGNIYNRWLGSVNLPSRSNTCVVITSITEIVWRTNEIHWEAFLRNCLQLPESKNLTKIEAMSIESSNLYLMSEHIVCETLHCLLTREAVATRNSHCRRSLSDIIKHVTGLLEGMHIINTYGFLHPGLTTKKLLVTTDGQLKLYDFCLADDASKIATLQRSKMFSATLNQFPPEMLISSEYTESSDVWSIAVTIWEIISDGMSPFPDDTEITSHKELFEPSFPWPEKYFQIKDNILYKCWSHNCAFRPSIHRLKATFLEIFQKLLDDSSYEIPMSTTYVAMGSPNIAEDTYS